MTDRIHWHEAIALHRRYVTACYKAAGAVGALVLQDEIVFAGPAQYAEFRQRLQGAVAADAELQGLFGEDEVST